MSASSDDDDDVTPQWCIASQRCNRVTLKTHSGETMHGDSAEFEGGFTERHVGRLLTFFGTEDDILAQSTITRFIDCDTVEVDTCNDLRVPSCGSEMMEKTEHKWTAYAQFPIHPCDAPGWKAPACRCAAKAPKDPSEAERESKLAKRKAELVKKRKEARNARSGRASKRARK